MSARVQLPAIATEENFENLILDLYNFKYPESYFQLYGKRGNKQEGIDIISFKKRIAIQCKKKEIQRDNGKLLKELKSDFEKSVQQLLKLKTEIDQLIFVSTYSNSTELNNYGLELKNKYQVPYSIIYIGWQDIERDALEHTDLLKKYYPEFFADKSIRTRIPFYDLQLLEGREALLEEIDQYVNKFAAFVIYGVGGIGKTTTLSSYLISRGQNTSLLWMEVQLESLKIDILTQLFPIFFSAATKEPSINDWDMLLKALMDTASKNIIVIDGLDEIGENTLATLEELSSTGWKLIITSRVKIADYPSINVAGIAAESARSLFKRHCHKDDELGSINRILQKLDYHPLLIELIAKSIQANYKLTLVKALDMIDENAIHDPALQQSIYVGKHASQYALGREHQVFKYLMLCFKINPLSEKEINQLQFFAILPQSAPISYEFYISFTGQSHSEELLDTLHLLHKKGLISHRQQAFYIHTIIQWVIREKIAIEPEKMKDAVINCLKSVSHYMEIPGTDFITYTTIAKNILTIVPLDGTTAYLSLFYAESLIRMSVFDRAKKYLEDSIAYLKANHGDSSDLYYGLLNSLASIDGFTSNYKQARVTFANSLQQTELNSREEALAYARRLDNMASTLEKMGKFEEALASTLTVIQIFEQYNDETGLALAYTNLANSYSFMQKFEEAIVFWEKGNRLITKLFLPDDSRYGDSYSTMGQIHLNNGRPDLAKPYFEKAIPVYEAHQNFYALSMGYFNLGVAELSLRKLRNAKIHLDQALALQKFIRGESPHNEATILMHIGVYYFITKDKQKAKSYFEKTLKILRDNSLEDVPQFAKAAQLLKELKRGREII